ncbi:MAG TPA: hypothetical protein VH351_16565 [Bryobacteraceae bacterium]|jgi:hypothetical protein|nr:hypothetical protein [Bryobacteraceae bacterium]
MRYQVHRIRDAAIDSFRWSPHTGGTAIIKPKDYQSGEELEAATPYAAWKLAAERNLPLRAGDVLELLNDSGSAGPLLIAKYIGFEPAAWWTPAPKPESVTLLGPDRVPAESIASK